MNAVWRLIDRFATKPWWAKFAGGVCVALIGQGIGHVFPGGLKLLGPVFVLVCGALVFWRVAVSRG